MSMTLKIEDGDYPKLLKKIANPPKLLYIRGNLLRNEACFGMVGSRRCSDYGKEIAFSIAKDLAKAGITIVSGMAKGIDTFSHQGALDGKGRTIAVFGTGLDEKSIYPKENIKLARKIIEKGGCLISEYPLGTRGKKQNFPERNRIISGMSLGTLVVEAKSKSGALITAALAQKQQRKVFAVPGSLHSLNSKGPHLLIKKGAKLIEKADDILKELNLFTPKQIFAKKIKGDSLEENLILKVLKEGSLPINKIIEKTNLPTQLVSSTLSLMEIEGKVKNLGGNVYVFNYS